MNDEDEKPGAGDRYGCVVALLVIVLLIAMGWWKVKGG